MSAEISLEERAAAHAALGDPARLAIVDALILGDASPSELARLVKLPSNLLAHHLKVLEHARLIERLRSEGDRRRSYVRLATSVLDGLGARKPRAAPRVVFVCTHNSARSQLAEALWRRSSTVPAASAGTRPAPRVHPGAVAAGRRHGLRLGRARTHRASDVLTPHDLVVAVCDAAHEDLGPALPRLHWSVPDPVRVGNDAAFERAFGELERRVDYLAPLVRPGSTEQARPIPTIAPPRSTP